jgi:hypothetical protein
MSRFRILETVGDDGAALASEIHIGGNLLAHIFDPNPRKVFRVSDSSALVITVDLGVDHEEFDTVALLGATFSSSGTWSWAEAATEAGLLAPVNEVVGISGRMGDNPRGEWYNSRTELPVGPRYRWQRITVSDALASDFQVSRAYFCRSFTFQAEYANGWNISLESGGKLRSGSGLFETTVQGLKYRVVDVETKYMTTAERDGVMRILERRGEEADIWMLRDYLDDSQITDYSVYGRFRDMLGPTAGPKNTSPLRFGKKISVREWRF